MTDRQGTTQMTTTILRCGEDGYVIMTCTNAMHYLTVKEERIVREDCRDMTPCRMLKSPNVSQNTYCTVCVRFMPNTSILKVFGF